MKWRISSKTDMMLAKAVAKIITNPRPLTADFSMRNYIA